MQFNRAFSLAIPLLYGILKVINVTNVTMMILYAYHRKSQADFV